MATNVWDRILSRVETKVNRHSFHTWFEPTTYVAEDGQALTVRVPNALFRDWLTKHYADVIDEAATELERSGIRISFITENEVRATIPVDPGPTPSRVEKTEPRPPVSSPPRGLNPRYQFDTFVVGPSNQFAHAAALAVAETPSRSYNPLYLYGGVGLGKTHLMHAIGQYLLTQTPDLKLTYISSERFMNEMINAVRFDSILEFRERYRTIDVLLVDDVQFLRRQGGHADRVLPHVQLALRRPEADRHQQRLPAHRHPGAGGTAAVPVRVGAHRRHPAARPRDEGRHSQEEGRRGGRAARRRRRALHRGPHQVEHP